MQSSDVIPSTLGRVPRRTDEKINETIKRQTEANVAYYASCDPQLLDIRIQELDREWDIERLLEVNAATVSLVGLSLARFVSRQWQSPHSCCNMLCRAGAHPCRCSADGASAHCGKLMKNGMH